MLSFVIRTSNDGAALEQALGALGSVMQPGEHVIALDAGSTDDTGARLAAFGETVGCDRVLLDTTVLKDGEAMALALDLARTPYVMLLGPQDRFRPHALQRLRNRLLERKPALAMLNSGWWYGDAEQVLPRIDHARMAQMPAQARAADLHALCPEPRRCVLARDFWRAHRTALAGSPEPAALYATLLAHSDEVSVLNAAQVLHPQAFLDPAPLMEAVGIHVAALPRAAQAAGLGDILICADEALVGTAPDAGDALLAGFEALLQKLPRRLRAVLRSHEGPAGKLMEAYDRRGRTGAKLCFVELALAEQQRRNERLTDRVRTLERELEAVLPAPAYLRALYDRVRNP